MTEPTADDLARWAEEHRPVSWGLCGYCEDEEWPCATTRLLALVAAQAEEMAVVRAALADFADHGLRADLMPTTPGGPESIPHLYRYLARLDQSVRERARAALDGTEATP